MEANTYSIVARCARTGELGVALASAVPAVGSMCPYVRPGLGAVTTQSWVNPYLASAILDLLGEGAGAEAALAAGDLATVMTEIAALPEEGRAAMADWVAMAEQRLAATNALGTLSQSLN